MRSSGLLVVVLVVASAFSLALFACDKDKSTADAKLAPSASALAPSTAAPSGKALRFSIDPKSTSSIDMPAPKEHIKAATSAALGTVEIDPTNLAASRGEVKVDLTTLATKTFAEDKVGDKKNDRQTVHARCWLEVGDCEDKKLDDDRKAANRYAVFAIRSIANPSATDLTKVPPTKDGADEVRTVTMTAKGELLIHGHKVDRDAEVEVQFRHVAGAPVDKPRMISIKTKTPLHVVLAEHDVKPRDQFGEIAKGAFHLLGTKVADTADISLELRANPQSW